MLYRRLIEGHLNDERVVLSNSNQSLTFRQIDKKTAQYCAFFQKMGIKKGDRIVVKDDYPLNTVLILLACISEGYIFVPISSTVTKETEQRIIKSCQPTIIVNSKEELPDFEVIQRRRELCEKDTLVYIIYTSGTEGIPKGVVASQKQILFCTDSINKRLENGVQDRILCCLPLSFDYGLYQVFLAFFSGAKLYVECGNILQRIPYFLSKWDITAFPTIPTVANLLVKTHMIKKEQFPKLRYISFTGEILTPALINEIEQIFSSARVIPMYGLTECKRVAIMPKGYSEKVRAGSCGIPLDGVDVFLENTDPQTKIGELVVEGNNVMEGYWGMEDEDTGVFYENCQTKKRGIRTGDLFKIDEDGFLYFCGRKNGIIKVRGYRVEGNWIKNRLNAEKTVIEVEVVGQHDSVTGERVAIYVYSLQKNIEETIRNVMREFPSYLQNYVLYVVDHPFPKNQNGKIDIEKLIKIVEV